MDLSNRPLLPNLCELLEAIKVQIGGKDFKWMEGSGHDMPLSESSPLFVYAASTRWTFGLIKNSELHHNQVCLCMCACVCMHACVSMRICYITSEVVTFLL